MQKVCNSRYIMQKLFSIILITFMCIGCSDSCNCPTEECNDCTDNVICDNGNSNTESDTGTITEEIQEEPDEGTDSDGTGGSTGEDTGTDTGNDSPVAVATNTEPYPFTGIVGFHNTYRRQVGVPDIKWSEELAVSAQEWADYLGTDEGGCKLKHSSVYYGENIAASSYPISAEKIVKMWADEQYYYDCKTGCQPGRVCGHYTQIVWSSTKEVGCGMVSCSPWNIYVCSYNPPGNIIGRKPYICD